MLGKSKHERLYYRLKEEIVELKPGDKIMPVRDMIRRYSVSQATVTKSLDRLFHEGLIEKNPGLGTFITAEVMKYRKDAKPIVVVAMPRWSSQLGVEIEYCFELAQQEYDFMVEFVHYNWQDGVPSELPKRKIDGLIIVPGQKLTRQHIKKLMHFNLPFVIFDHSVAGIEVNSVCSDNHFTGALAAAHLIKLGHKRLALVISEPKVTSIVRRIEGFTQYCELQNIQVEIIDCGINSGDRSVEKVYQTLKNKLEDGLPGYSAIFVVSETAVLGVYKAFHEHGIAIPQDISVIGVDDQSDSDFYFPALTTISSNIKKLTKIAAETVLAQIKAKGNRNFYQKKLKSKIITRESTCNFNHKKGENR